MMVVYGMGGVGKTTFASSFPKPLMLDFENGAKYLGERGINMDVAVFKTWLTTDDKKQLREALKDYETIVIDPIGEAMDKLIEDTNTINTKGSRRMDGALTMQGWGIAKKEMKNFIKFLRDTGKHVVIVAHVAETEEEGRLVKRPAIATSIKMELVNMVDIVGYMRIHGEGEDQKRIIEVGGSTEYVVKKDRTGKLGKVIKPEFDYIANLLTK